MEYSYRLTISSDRIYREVELGPKLDEVRIGTAADCAVRLGRGLFWEPVELTLCRAEGEWHIFCSDNLYFTAGQAYRLFARKLVHGDELQVKYRDSDHEVFALSFHLDFAEKGRDYDVEIDIAGRNSIKIGKDEDSDICFADPYPGEDFAVLERAGEEWLLRAGESGSGILVNGVPMDDQAEIKEHDFFCLSGFSFYYRSDRLYTSGQEGMRLRGLASRKVNVFRSQFCYPHFNRSSRVQCAIPRIQLEIRQALVPPAKPKRDPVITLIPSIAMLAMTIVLRGFIGGGGLFVLYSALSMGLGILMSLAATAAQRRDYQRECARRQAYWAEYMEEKRRSVENARRDEWRARNQIYIPLEESIREVEAFGSRLFEKSPGEKDFLQVYLGKGRVRSANPVMTEKNERADLEDPLAEAAERLAENYQYLDDAPVAANFGEAGGIGVVGPREALEQMLKNMTLDIAIRHFHKNVRMVFVLTEEAASALRWVRWLPHVENERLDIRNIVCDEESRNLVLEDLCALLSDREKKREENGKNREVSRENYVVFVTDVPSVSTHPLARYVKNGADYGFTFVFFAEHEEFLPWGCRQLIRLKASDRGSIFETENAKVQQSFIFPAISDKTAAFTAWRLGAVQVDEIALAGELTKNITLFELLDILTVQDLNLQERWGSSACWQSLAAPIGVRAKNQTVYLDIGDKTGAHGPHGLVAGTTGSGKSEVLQTYILSMATLFHPYEAGFVLIDFKGGGMANQFRQLPHLLGTVTNIDGREIDRSLLSIKAELFKRQEIFSRAGVNHIDDYMKLYRSGRSRIPLPHLIIIVDEFAQLKQEYPDFMRELISAARIGRTLGIHLILATQKPAGVVDAQIWSNSRFRLCLKVQTKEDSSEMIKTPLAAEIVEPGRAYLQVGNNEVFALFQSAYSGAPVPEEEEKREKFYVIYERNLWGKRTLKYTNRGSEQKESSLTQLKAIVTYVSDYCRRQGIERLPGICLPPLCDRICADELPDRQEGRLSVPAGIYDDPGRQLQETVWLEPWKENIYIVGSAQTGKSTLLQTILYGLIRRYTTEQVNIYIVDCGSMMLRIFEESAHVGGVVMAGEEEKCRNLFRMLNDLIFGRKKILADRGVGSYAAYLEAGYEAMPLIVVAIDNVAAFREYFPEQAEEIGVMTREALGAGISFVVTAAASSALNYRTQANFSRRLALNCNDEGEYSALLGYGRRTPGGNPGRGLFVQDKRILEYQAAIVGRGEREADRSRELMDFIGARNKKCRSRAARIPMVPERLYLNEVLTADEGAFRAPGVLPIGMEYATVSLTSINVFADGFLALSGDENQRFRFVANLLKMISLIESRTGAKHGMEVSIADDRSRKLSPFLSRSFVRRYASDSKSGISLIGEFCEAALRGFDGEGKDETCQMLIIAGTEVFRKVCADKLLGGHLARVLKNASGTPCFVLLAAVENQPVNYSSCDVLKIVKEERQGIVFADLADCRLFEVPGRVKRDVTFDSTMGYRFRGSTYFRIKIFD